MGFPFKRIPVKLGFNSQRSNWSSWYTQTCSQNSFNSSFAQKLSSYTQTINSNVLNAFNKCIQSQGLHVWVERTDDRQIFIVQAKFVTPTKKVSSVEMSLSPGRNVTCNYRNPVKIGASAIPIKCSRSGNDAVVVTLTSDWAIVENNVVIFACIWKYS